MCRSATAPETRRRDAGATASDTPTATMRQAGRCEARARRRRRRATRSGRCNRCRRPSSASRGRRRRRSQASGPRRCAQGAQRQELEARAVTVVRDAPRRQTSDHRVVPAGRGASPLRPRGRTILLDARPAPPRRTRPARRRRRNESRHRRARAPAARAAPCAGTLRGVPRPIRRCSDVRAPLASTPAARDWRRRRRRATPIARDVRADARLQPHLGAGSRRLGGETPIEPDGSITTAWSVGGEYLTWMPDGDTKLTVVSGLRIASRGSVNSSKLPR